ncbi:hypothetical protein H0I23_08545 [Cellulophaga sp. HaHaR_3_176]|uniref:hypothetical protein n=1 Tax=Cellulophaga sp. HaHaR_3_176 TaxID=1942464 RepID=UPI001C1F5934|nr:hypothetical protein [Cellulophaga sp. HaHaR_3_176]QWX82526.1 hypothetical protein H0I23_08545 [Cellulophaga sp. HaHaR_3_176]
MNKFFAYILILGTIVQVCGQSSDILIWKKDTLNLYSNPLEKRTDWQKINQSISKQIEEHLLATSNDSIIEISSFLQNYKTEWRIEKGNLYLNKITSFENLELSIDLITKSKNTELPIFAEWLTDSLIIFKGNCIVCESNHLKNTSIYPNELILEFRKGTFVNKSKYKNRVLKKSKLSDLDPNQYLEYIYSKINWSQLDKMDKNIQAFVSIEPDKNGKLKKIDWEYTYLISDNNIITNKQNRFLKEAVRIAKYIPDWTVILRHEKIMNQDLSIIFSPEIKEKYAR